MPLLAPLAFTVCSPSLTWGHSHVKLVISLLLRSSDWHWEPSLVSANVVWWLCGTVLWRRWHMSFASFLLACSSSWPLDLGAHGRKTSWITWWPTPRLGRGQQPEPDTGWGLCLPWFDVRLGWETLFVKGQWTEVLGDSLKSLLQYMAQLLQDKSSSRYYVGECVQMRSRKTVFVKSWLEAEFEPRLLIMCLRN
jgi:hypothetical protein